METKIKSPSLKIDFMKKFTIILDTKKGAKGVFEVESREVFKVIDRANDIIDSARAKYIGSFIIKDEAGQEVVKQTSMA